MTQPTTDELAQAFRDALQTVKVSAETLVTAGEALAAENTRLSERDTRSRTLFQRIVDDIALILQD